MASDPTALKTSAVQKLAEFARLKYPSKLLWTACTTMGVNTRDPTWFRVREKIPSAEALGVYQYVYQHGPKADSVIRHVSMISYEMVMGRHMIPIVLRPSPPSSRNSPAPQCGRVARRDVTTGWAWWRIAAERPSVRSWLQSGCCERVFEL